MPLGFFRLVSPFSIQLLSVSFFCTQCTVSLLLAYQPVSSLKVLHRVSTTRREPEHLVLTQFQVDISELFDEFVFSIKQQYCCLFLASSSLSISLSLSLSVFHKHTLHQFKLHFLLLSYLEILSLQLIICRSIWI